MDDPDSTKFQNNPIVTLDVGPAKHTFHVHQELLFKYSPVFKAAFSGACRESSEHRMALPEDDPETVERFMQWLYFESLDLTKGACLETWHECCWQLARLNTFADKFDVGLLKNSIIDELFALRMTAGRAPQPLVVAHIYDNTTETSSLRKLIVGWYAWHVKYDWYTLSGTPAILEDIPKFAADLAIAMRRRVQDPNLKSPFSSEPSSYYEDAPKRSRV